MMNDIEKDSNSKEAFHFKKFIKETQRQRDNNNIDDLNDETFGDGAITDDWETFHRTATKLDNNDNNTATSTGQQKQWPLKEENVMSKFQDITLKDLWSDDTTSSIPFSPSPSSSSTTRQQQHVMSNNIQLAPNIWSSPVIPSPSNKKDTPTMRTVADLEREMAQLSPPLTHLSSPPHLSSSPSHLSPSHLSSSPSQQHNIPIGHILHHTLPSNSPPTHSQQPMRPPLIPYGFPHPMAGPHPHHMMLPHGPHPPLFMRGPLPPNVPMRGPPRMIPRGGLMPHPQHMRLPVMGFRPPYMHHGGPHPQQPFPPIPINAPPTSLPRFPSKLNEMLCDLKPDGSGFMNQKEKEWVIKVQLLQLHTSAPEIDDYYYQRYIEKKFLMEHKSEGIVSANDKSMENLTLPPPVNQQGDKKKSKPDFENTLGKITVNSVSAPRKTIDISQSTVSSSSSSSSEIGTKKRRVLLTIEEMYNLLLKLDSIDVSDSSFVQTQHEICDKIFDLTSLQNVLSNSDESAIKGEIFFQQILHFRKGKSALKRILPILSEKQAKIILLCISKSIYTIVRKDDKDKVLQELIPSLRRVILTLNLSEVSSHVSHLTAATTAKLIDNMFFSEYFVSFISRGSMLSIDLSSEERQKWSLKLKNLQTALLNVKTKPTSLLLEEINKSLSVNDD